MKAILIDPSNKSVTDIERTDDYRNIATLIGAGSGLFCAVRIGRRTMLYVDDEGLLVQPNPHGYFRIAADRVLAGKGLIVGSNDEGGDEDVLFTARQIAPHIEFIENPDPADIEPTMTVTAW